MEANKTTENKHMEDAALNFTDNRIIGVLFMMAQIGHIFLRRRFGVRILQVQNILFTWSGLMLCASLADWITSLPLLGAKLDYASFRLFGVIYLIWAIYHLVRAYLDSRHIPFRYTRHLGDSYVVDLVTKFDIPFFKKNVLRINAVAEPIVMFVIAEIIGRTLSPNLGIFLKLVAISMCAIGIFVIQNHNKLKYNQNDSIVLSDVTQHNMKGAKPSAKKSVSQVTKASQAVSPRSNRSSS